jgi:hypothetical protein
MDYVLLVIGVISKMRRRDTVTTQSVPISSDTNQTSWFLKSIKKHLIFLIIVTRHKNSIVIIVRVFVE